ncbi:hypothetical protein [Limimaricola litoreus]|uniref:hypothetical protein n=1 Tax=Limimaricola litoreus TaxID=2955316 RepID=UPI0035145902
MAGLALGAAALAALAGLQAALWFDTPVGPSIVCVAVALFVGSLPLRMLAGARG